VEDGLAAVQRASAGGEDTKLHLLVIDVSGRWSGGGGLLMGVVGDERAVLRREASLRTLATRWVMAPVH
jgi:hypothetical protein